MKSALVLDRVAAKAGFAHADTYRRALDLARPWTTQLALVDFYGNPGMQGETFPPADPRYTEIGLTEAGRACVDGEVMPLGMAFGTMYKGGPTPSFDIRNVIAAVRAALAFEPTQKVSDLLGAPTSPTGSHVSIDVAALHRGDRTPLTFRASITETEIPELNQHGLVISNFPPQVAVDDVASRLVHRVESGDELQWIARIDDLSQFHSQRLCISIQPGHGFSAEELYSVWGIEVVDQVRLPLSADQLPMSASQFVSAWVQSHPAVDVEAGLLRLESLLA